MSDRPTEREEMSDTNSDYEIRYMASVWPDGPGTPAKVRWFGSAYEAESWVAGWTSDDRRRLIEPKRVHRGTSGGSRE